MPIAVVLVAGTLYILSSLFNGWIPHDEGTLAHSAERVLRGDLPHRDFTAVYTGGLAYLHAAALSVLGMSLRSLRWVLFGFVVLWIPALYYIATRFVGRLLAALVVLLAIVWSVPNYAAAIPSWYNLILTSFAVAALLRYLETDHRAWIFAAGAFGGLSILVKIVGLYFVAAAFLFFVFREQDLSTRHEQGSASTGRAYSIVLTVGLACLAGVLTMIAARFPGLGAAYHFALPGLAVVLLVCWREWRVARPSAVERVRALMRPVLPFLTGVLIPVGAFAALYALAGALDDLIIGVFIRPTARFSYASVPPMAVRAIAPAIALFALVAAEPMLGRQVRWIAAGLLLVAASLLWAEGGEPGTYRLVWSSARPIVPLVVVAGTFRLASGRHQETAGGRTPAALFLLLATVALFSLIQFPFAAPIYFLYVAPIAILAAVAVISPVRRRPLLVIVLTFYLAFGVRWLNSGYVYQLGHRYLPTHHTEMLDFDRGGLRVSPIEAAEYEKLVKILLEHEEPGQYTFATPDSPEVYFLAGLRNATPALYDFFEDQPGRAERVLRALELHDVNVVAINTTPGYTVYPDRIDGAPFSSPDTALMARLAMRYPRAARAGTFIVRWRE